MAKVPSAAGTPCPTCKKRYGDILKHGRKHHPYEVDHDSAWATILKGTTTPDRANAPAGPGTDKKAPKDEVPPPPKRPRMSEVRSTRWDSPLPYRGIIHLHLDAHSYDEANEELMDLFKAFKKLAKDQKSKIVVEYEQTHERF
jgi:hypothetical protein